VRLEGLGRPKNPVISLDIEIMTIRLVAQRFEELHYSVNYEGFSYDLNWMSRLCSSSAWIHDWNSSLPELLPA
jgi:hypothetical protein